MLGLLSTCSDELNNKKSTIDIIISLKFKMIIFYVYNFIKILPNAFPMAILSKNPIKAATIIPIPSFWNGIMEKVIQLYLHYCQLKRHFIHLYQYDYLKTFFAIMFSRIQQYVHRQTHTHTHTQRDNNIITNHDLFSLLYFAQ